MPNAVPLLLLLCAALSACHADPMGQARASPTPDARASILGRWSVQTVRTQVRPVDGSPPFSQVVRVPLGANNQTFTADNKVVHRAYALALDERTYRYIGDSLLTYDSTHVFRERITELTPIRLVSVSEVDWGGAPATITTTHTRLSEERLDSARRAVNE